MTATPYENIYPKQNQECSLFTKCCFCIPLKTGCFILGYISLVLNFLITLFFLGTLSFLAIYTHGFRFIRYKLDEDGEEIPDEDSMDRSKLSVTIVVIVLTACLNIAWFIMNMVLLVGLHKKRPGHIKLHVTVASIRLLLTLIGLVSYNAHTINSNIICYAEVGLSAYFIFLYYRYALQLEQEQRSGEAGQVSNVVSDVVFTYPKTIDKLNLTEKNEKLASA